MVPDWCGVPASRADDRSAAAMMSERSIDGSGTSAAAGEDAGFASWRTGCGSGRDSGRRRATGGGVARFTAGAATRARRYHITCAAAHASQITHPALIAGGSAFTVPITSATAALLRPHCVHVNRGPDASEYCVSSVWKIGARTLSLAIAVRSAWSMLAPLS